MGKKYVGLNNKSLPNYFEEHIVKSTRRHFPSFTSNVEILTEIQHYRGKTNLLDFSRNLYVALLLLQDNLKNYLAQRMEAFNNDSSKWKSGLLSNSSNISISKLIEHELKRAKVNK